MICSAASFKLPDKLPASLPESVTLLDNAHLHYGEQIDLLGEMGCAKVGKLTSSTYYSSLRHMVGIVNPRGSLNKFPCIPVTPLP